jgi:hypothetical protein
VMLHWWAGPIECEHPRRGIWGGPPDGARRPPPSATNTAFIRRRRAPLDRWVRDDVPEIGLRRHRPASSGGTRSPKTSREMSGIGALVLGSFFGLSWWRRRREG